MVLFIKKTNYFMLILYKWPRVQDGDYSNSIKDVKTSQGQNRLQRRKTISTFSANLTFMLGSRDQFYHRSGWMTTSAKYTVHSQPYSSWLSLTFLMEIKKRHFLFFAIAFKKYVVFIFQKLKFCWQHIISNILLWQFTAYKLSFIFS